MHLKINAVALRGINDRELPDFFEFIRRNPVDFRLIEFMPMGGRPCGVRITIGRRRISCARPENSRT
jgi:molybdenum cofactor biosynthesis enzyme MoaA